MTPLLQAGSIGKPSETIKKIKWTSIKAYLMFKRKGKKTNLSVVCIFYSYFDFSTLSPLIIYANIARKIQQVKRMF